MTDLGVFLQWCDEKGLEPTKDLQRAWTLGWETGRKTARLEYQAQLNYYKSGSLPMQKRAHNLVEHLLELRDDYLLDQALELLDDVLQNWEEANYFDQNSVKRRYDELVRRSDLDSD